MASGSKSISKEDYISFFNQYTNNIFKDRPPPDFDNIITDMTSAKSNSTDPNRKIAIIKKIITPYYDKLSFGTLSPLTAKTSTIKKTRPLKQKNFYLTNLFPHTKRLLVGINSDFHKENIKERMKYVWPVLNILQHNADGNFEEYKDKIKREQALIYLISVLTNTLKLSGCKYSYALLKSKSLTQHYEKNGYIESGTYNTEMIKIL